MSKIGYQLAQINIAKMKGKNINDPIMKEFVDNLDHINSLAEASKGFIWRLKDESNNATQLNPYNDERLIINVSVWKDLISLQEFMYNTHHAHFMKKRRNWFEKMQQPSTALWWIKDGNYPTAQDAAEKLTELQNNGSSDSVFDFNYAFRTYT